MLRRLGILGMVAIELAGCRVEARDDSLGDKDPQSFGLGHTPALDRLAALDIDVSPDGAGLPPGSGTAEQGATVYATSCAACHGVNGEGRAPYPALVSAPRPAFDFASDPKIPKTIGNYWPYATTLFDYVRRAMPLTAPGSLTADQTYAVTAYLLTREQVIPAGTVLDAKSLPQVRMPARDKFVVDDRRGNRGGKDVR
jgi:S-disulfanyl-L-cysteine oxidoreductase SoxD